MAYRSTSHGKGHGRRRATPQGQKNADAWWAARERLKAMKIEVQKSSAKGYPIFKVWLEGDSELNPTVSLQMEESVANYLKECVEHNR